MRLLAASAGRCTRPVFIGALLALSAGAAHAAANFSVYPLRLSLPATRLTTAVTLGNAGAAAVTVQAEVFRWSQGPNGEELTPTQDLVVSPPVFKLAAGGTQQVRVGRLKRGTAPAVEGSYRLLLTEVIPDASLRIGVSTAMRISLPVFVPPAQRGPDARLALIAANADVEALTLRVQLRNAGVTHGKLLGSTLVQSGATCAENTHNEYLLPGVTRELRVPSGWRGCAAGAATLRLKMQGKPEALTQDVLLPAVTSP